ncbi:MAG: prolyl oligopeptidase family serine peptidase, partial [Bacillota bacterium]|nr:prolyl oligopeptidase family serine peptidase [Bacillota bacterium]
ANGEAVKAASSQQDHICIDLSRNFTSNKPVTFKLYMPDSSKTPRDVVMYLAYGNWIAINEKNVDYLVDDLTQNDYGAVVFTGKTRLDTDIIGIVQDIREKIVYLKNHASEYGIRHIYLSGGSAGANLALLAAYASSCPDYASDGLTADQVKTDGVIAFYPVVDMLYNYHYFTDKTENQKTALDKLGDAFFSLSDVNGSKSISDSQKIVTKTLLGGSPEEGNFKHLYEISSPNRFLSRNVPPTFLIQGSDDSMTPFEPTKAMYENLEKLDVDADMLELPHTDHAFDMVLPNSSVVTNKVLSCINEWLDLHHSPD